MARARQVSEKQLAANRANAQRSTGPRTPEGKAISRYNALKHGVLAKAIIPDALANLESQEDFDQLLIALGDYFAPSGAMEELLVQQVAVAYWRLARLYRAEAGAIAKHNDAYAADLAAIAAFSGTLDPAARLLAEQQTLEALLRDVSALPDDGAQPCQAAEAVALRAHIARYGAVATDAPLDDLVTYARDLLATLRGRRRAIVQHTRVVEEAFRSIPTMESAITFSRYEAALQNQLDRALFRLDHLRARTPLRPIPLSGAPQLASSEPLHDA